MDLNKFFRFFTPIPEEQDDIDGLKILRNSPFYKIGMFTRLILNGLSFKNQLLDFFSKSSEDLDLDGVDLAGEFMMYNRAYYWIKQLDWSDELWVNDLKSVSDENLLTAIKLSIHFFEEQEEYEKCAFLKEIQDFVQNYLAVGE